VCFVAPRDDIRIIVNIPGRYSLVSKLDLNGARREFACRVISMSTRRMGLVAPVSGPLGERVVTYIPRFGRLDGQYRPAFPAGLRDVDQWEPGAPTQSSPPSSTGWKSTRTTT